MFALAYTSDTWIIDDGLLNVSVRDDAGRLAHRPLLLVAMSGHGEILRAEVVVDQYELPNFISRTVCYNTSEPAKLLVDQCLLRYLAHWRDPGFCDVQGYQGNCHDPELHRVTDCWQAICRALTRLHRETYGSSTYWPNYSSSVDQLNHCLAAVLNVDYARYFHGIIRINHGSPDEQHDRLARFRQRGVITARHSSPTAKAGDA